MSKILWSLLFLTDFVTNKIRLPIKKTYLFNVIKKFWIVPWNHYSWNSSIDNEGNFNIFRNHEGDLSQKSPNPNMWLLVNHSKASNTFYCNNFFLTVGNYKITPLKLQFWLQSTVWLYCRSVFTIVFDWNFASCSDDALLWKSER